MGLIRVADCSQVNIILHNKVLGFPKAPFDFHGGCKKKIMYVDRVALLVAIIALLFAILYQGKKASLYSATFFDTTTQNNGGATTANQVAFNSTQQSSGFTLGPDNRINVLNSGTYFLDLSLQLTFTGGASNYNVTVWFTVDDTIVQNSSFTFTTTGAQNDQTLAKVTDTIALSKGQYIKFYWWSQATGMKLLPTAAGSSPSRPASPSVNFSIFNVA